MSYEDRDKFGMYKGKDSGPGPQLMGASTLIGDKVVNGADEDLGEIKEIMLDMNSGQVAYCVLAFGGFLGMGEKLFAVPWQALHLDTINKRFVLNVDKERLKNAPGFNPDDWPDMSDVQWAQQIHAFYGTDINRPGAPSMGPGVPMGGMVGGAGAAGMGAGMGSSVGAGSAGSSGVGAGTAGSSGTGAGSAGSSGTGAGSAGSSDLGTGAGGGSMGSGNAGVSSGSGSTTTGTGAGSSGTGTGGGSSGTGSGSGTGSSGTGGSGGTSGSNI